MFFGSSLFFTKQQFNRRFYCAKRQKSSYLLFSIYLIIHTFCIFQRKTPGAGQLLPVFFQYVAQKGLFLSRNRGAKLAGFVQLVHFLHCQAGLCHHISGLREAVVESVVVTDTDGIGDFVPIVVGIQAVAGLGTLGIVQAAIAAGEVEAVAVMGQVALTYL